MSEDLAPPSLVSSLGLTALNPSSFQHNAFALFAAILVYSSLAWGLSLQKSSRNSLPMHQAEVFELEAPPPLKALPPLSLPPPPPPKAARVPHKVAAPAKVGALLTAQPPPTASAHAAEPEPVSFLSDPHGGSYGSTVVAQGSHQSAPGGFAKPAEAGDASTMQGVTAPKLKAGADVCKGFFPAQAVANDARVQVLVHVDADGLISQLDVIREEPPNQGFFAAARRCLQAQRFRPARNAQNENIEAELPLTLRFTR